MRLALFASAAFLLLAGPARAGEAAPAAEPTIDDMIAKAREMAAKQPTGPAKEAKPLVESAYLKAMRERVSLEMGKRAEDCQRRNDNIGLSSVYFDVQFFKDALDTCNKALQRGNTDGQVRTGGVHQSLGRVRFMLGQEEQALKDLEEAANRTDNSWTLQSIEGIKKWGKALPENQERAAKLKEKIAADPADAESRWQLMQIYRGDVPMQLDELLGTIQIKENFPKFGPVVDGSLDWRLMELFWHFGIRDEALKLAQEFREKYPKHGCSTGGDATYRLGDYCEQMRRYPEALACYKEVRDKYEKHWACQPRRDGPPYIFDRINAVKGR